MMRHVSVPLPCEARSASKAERPLLLVVDDEGAIRDFVTRFAHICDFRAVACSDGLEALDFLDRQSADIALVDLRMPHLDGLEVLRAVRHKDPHCQVVLMSGVGTVGDAVAAIKLGARDFLQKPFDTTRLEALLTQVRTEIEKRRAVVALQRDLIRETELCGMIGHSAVMQELFDLVRRLAPHLTTALIVGESGTGKELVARALHQMGPRRPRAFLEISCSGLAETPGESDLFGRVAGAFPGATDERIGAFESADGGVLLLDDVCELPLALQGRLLPVLEHRRVTRIGSFDARAIDVVVIAATKRDPQTEMLAGRFRRELFHRLSSVEIRLPPLRDRREDISYLVTAFVRDAAGRLGKPVAGLTSSAEMLLQRRAWPGNVRELRNTIEQACLFADGEFITERDLQHVLKQTSWIG